MALGRIYTVDGGILAIAAAGPTTVMAVTPAATNPIDIQAIRFAVLGAASFPSNASLNVVLARASSGFTSGGSTITANPHNAGDVAANSVWKNCQSTAAGGTFAAIVGYTQGVTLWEQAIPFTAGSNWAEWVTPGSEWRVAASAFAAVYLTQSSAGTATSFSCELVFAE
jgi:hypothetical protein